MKIKSGYGEIHLVVEYNNENDRGNEYMDNFVEDVQELLFDKYRSKILMIKGDEWNPMTGNESDISDECREHKGEGF